MLQWVLWNLHFTLIWEQTHFKESGMKPDHSPVFGSSFVLWPGMAPMLNVFVRMILSRASSAAEAGEAGTMRGDGEESHHQETD